MTLAEVKLWGRTIGAVSLEDGGRFAAFQYDPAFAGSGIEVSPLTMPLRDRVYLFPDLPAQTFHGLPGLLADSLPDRFGNALIDTWLSTQGRTPQSFNAVERLCYTGARGMGALAFVPALGPKPQPAKKIEIDALVKLASEILGQRKNLKTSFASDRRKNALNDILRVGTSAGGARAKSRNQRSSVRTGRRGKRLRLLAVEIRWRHRKQRQGTRRPQRVWSNRIRLFAHGEGGGRDHERVPAARRKRPTAFHEPAL